MSISDNPGQDPNPNLWLGVIKWILKYYHIIIIHIMSNSNDLSKELAYMVSNTEFCKE